MADRYWVGGTGTWNGTNTANWSSSSGGAGGASVPTSVDDVFFDANSDNGGPFTVTQTTVSGVCRNFTISGLDQAMTLAGGNTFNVYGSLSFQATNLTITWQGGSSPNNGWVFRSTSTGNTIDFGGRPTRGRVFFNGSGGGWTLTNNLTISGGSAYNDLNLVLGTLITNGYSVTCDGVVSSSSHQTPVGNVRGFNITNSTININASFFSASLYFDTNTPNFTVTTTNSTINIPFAADFRGGAKTYNNVNITYTSAGTTNFIGENTFNNLTITPPSATGVGKLITFDSNQTISGTLDCAGATAIRRIMLRSNTAGTARTLTVNSLSANDCDFLDITISGTAAGSSPTRAGDCGGNSGITFPSPKTVYWNLSGTQNWSATGWATTNNGAPDINNFPLAQDTATFTDSGSAGTVSIQAFNIGSIDASTRTSAMTLSFATAAVALYGSIAFGSGVTVSGTTAQTFSGRGTMDYTSASKTTTFPITVDTPSGTFRLIDAFNSSSTVTHTRGTFNANNQNLTCTTFASSNSNTRTITMGSGTWTLSGTGTVWNTGTTTSLTFNKDTANIVLSNTTTTARTFTGGGLTYNKLTIGGATGTSTLTIQGSNTFSEIDSTKTVAHTVTFTAGTTTTVTTWSVKGTAGNVVTLNSSGAGNSYTLAKAGGGYLKGIDYLNVRDAIGSPISDTWYIGANSVINTTAPNSGYAMFTTQRADNAIVVLTSTSSTTWTVPSDWNNAFNSINLIGGGGGGGRSFVFGTTGVNNSAGGGGGGGGGFTQLTNQTLSGSITYQAGAAGAGGSSDEATAGGTTSWNSGAATAGGGGGGLSTATPTPTSTGGTGGTGSTFNGGNGGAGSTSTAASTGNGGGGGGGAGGPNGVGKNGGNGFASTTSANIAGGGGGGNGGGTNGGNATSATGGTGGNNSAGAGGGASDTSGVVGGGGGGTVSATSVGGSGIELFGIGSGGGAGGADDASRTNNIGGFFGGGGGGAGTITLFGTRPGAPGRQGAIIIVYTPFIAKSTTTLHRLSNTGILQTNTYYDEIGVTCIRFANNVINGVLDEVTRPGPIMRTSNNSTIYINNYFDEVSGIS